MFEYGSVAIAATVDDLLSSAHRAEKEGNLEGALSIYTDARKWTSSPRMGDIVIGQMHVLRVLERGNDALAVADEYLADSPDCKVVLDEKVKLLIGHGATDQALEAAVALFPLERTNRRNLERLVRLYEESDQPQHEGVYSEAMARLNLAKGYDERDTSPDMSMRSFCDVMWTAGVPDDLYRDAAFCIARLLKKEGQYDEIHRLAQWRLAQNADDVGMLANDAYALLHLGETDAAVAQVKKAIDLQERMPEHFFDFYVTAGRPDELRESIEIALNNHKESLSQRTGVSPHHYDRLMNAAHDDFPKIYRELSLSKLSALNQSGMYEEVDELTESWLIRNPDDIHMLMARENALRALQKYTEAVAVLEHVISIDPSADKYNLLGVNYCKLGELRAFNMFWKAAELDPDTALYFNNLGYVFQRLGQHENAIGAANSALRLSSDDETAWRLKAGSWFDLEDYENLEAHAREATKRFDSLYYPLLAGHALMYLDRAEEAIEFYEISVSRGVEWENSYNLACAHMRVGDKESAYSALEISLPLFAEMREDHEIQSPMLDPDFESIRHEQRFIDLVTTYCAE